MLALFPPPPPTKISKQRTGREKEGRKIRTIWRRRVLQPSPFGLDVRFVAFGAKPGLGWGELEERGREGEGSEGKGRREEGEGKQGRTGTLRASWR